MLRAKFTCRGRRFPSENTFGITGSVNKVLVREPVWPKSQLGGMTPPKTLFFVKSIAWCPFQPKSSYYLSSSRHGRKQMGRIERSSNGLHGFSQEWNHGWHGYLLYHRMLRLVGEALWLTTDWKWDIKIRLDTSWDLNECTCECMNEWAKSERASQRWVCGTSDQANWRAHGPSTSRFQDVSFQNL